MSERMSVSTDLLHRRRCGAAAVSSESGKFTGHFFSWTRRRRRHLLAVLLGVWAILDFAQAQSGGWPVRVVGDARPPGDCEGFPNATKNACGFCTDGSTGLPRDFGRNCFGNCQGAGVVDCNGVCGGAAYMDECSGICIGGSTGRTAKDVASFRDCRGYCTSSGGQFFVDSCGVCHTGSSPFMDCTNRCHLPSQEEEMAKLLCGRCVGGTGGVPESEVIDSCGNCKSEVLECPCNGTGQPDLCGVCNGRGVSCMRVVGFQPRAIPANAHANFLMEGAFRGKTGNVRCVFVLIVPPTDALGNRTELTAVGNGTHVRCRVRLPAGSYRVGVKMDVGGPPESHFVEASELMVYDEADYTTMSPSKAVFDRGGASELTVTFSGGRVPPLPLTCIISGEDWPKDLRLAPSVANTLDACVIPYANSSMKIDISPSFNGDNPFPTSFPLKFQASPPDMKKYYVAEDGHAVMVVFDREVNLCELVTCDQILNNETLHRLGEGVSCRWATKQQLIITVQRPIAGNPIRVTFKKGVLKQDGQKYAQPKNDSLTIDAWYPEPASSAQLSLSGPNAVSECGDLVLVGHFSSPKGDAAYYWTAFRGDHRKLEDVIADALLVVHSASLVLDASLLEMGADYEFVLTAEQPGGGKYEARHVVVRRPHAGAMVSAYSDAMASPSVATDQRIVLQASISLPPCVPETELVHLMWSVDNPAVKFDFKNRLSHIYRIEPYALPENTEVTFTATAFFGNMLNATTSKVTLRVEPMKLKAAIKGAWKRITGNKNCSVVLESENLNRGVALVYQWRCYDEKRIICYNYRKNATEPLLIPPKSQNRPRLEVKCDSLKAGDTLTFELQVFNAKNRDQYSQSATALLIVKNGSLPQVVIDSVIADGTDSMTRHPTTGAYHVPAGLTVTIHATVKDTAAKLKSIRWDIKGYSAPYTYSALNGRTFLNLEEGFLVGHGIYLVGLSACDKKGSCGIANLTVHAVPGTALCRLQLPPHVEYEQLQVRVVDCSIPPGRQPVTYQLYLHGNSDVFPLTPPQTSTIFHVIAPPQQHDSRTQMSVEVCDRYSLCHLYSGPVVRVVASENSERDRRRLMERAVKAIRTNDPMTALSLYLTATMDTKSPLNSQETDSAIDAATKAVSNRYLTAGQLALIYSAMLPFCRQNERTDVQTKALAVIRAATRLAFAYKVKVPTSVLSRGHSNAAEALGEDAGVARRVRDTLDFFAEKTASAVALGSRLAMSSPHPGYPSTLIFRPLLDGAPVHVRARSADGVVEGAVSFGEDIQERVRKRPCKKRAECEGAVVALTLYPGAAPYPADNRRSSPVMDVTLRKPEDGEPLHFRDMTNSVRLSLTHYDNATVPVKSGMAYKCLFWDDSRRQWSSEGVVTVGVEGNMRTCLSSHLSAFTVMEVYDGLSTGSIVGITVASLIGFFIIIMLAFFFFRKKQARTARVSTEALQPKRTEKMSTNGTARTKATLP